MRGFFFRAENLNHALNYIKKIFIGDSIFIMPQFYNRFEALTILCLIVCFLFFEWVGRENKFAIEKFHNDKKIIGWAMYIVICILIYFNLKTYNQQFIYFQF